MKLSDEIGDATRLVNMRIRIHHQPTNSPIKSIDYHSKIYFILKISVICCDEYPLCAF